ncbi:HEPN domain-containing protein [Pseudomonas aeruginosa]|uniref:HEPN domain-containing protein n=1 Tax=Pseudomonas aeruginosa TaxID=287 RepID=UPI000F52EC93|nr:HEPN domain-containing protein [Pseudomonas aeruginosa]
MRFRSLDSWDDVAGSAGLVYFAQLIDEMLFDYTLDAYKPSAMNTCLLVGEAAATIKSIESGVIQKPNLEHILRELCSSLSKDDVAKEMLTVDILGVMAALNSNLSLSSADTIVDLLGRQMKIEEYKGLSELILVNEICGPNRLPVIRSLARSYITTLLNFGYSSKYLGRVVREFFFSSSNRVTDSGSIKGFFQIFSNEPVGYKVFCKAPKYFKSFNDLASRLGISMPGEIEVFSSAFKQHGFKLSGDEIYLVFDKVSALDPYVANSMVHAKLNQLQTLIGLYHHKATPRYFFESIVVEPDGKVALKAARVLHPMHKCLDHKVGAAARKLNEFVAGFSMKKESFRKFNRSAELHALALSSDSTENQMINLWIALESLIPNKSDAGKASIEHVIDSVMPFLNSVYVKKVILRLSKDLLLWNSRLVKKLLKGVGADDLVSRTASLLILEKYQAQRSELEASFGDFLLLSDRYSYVKDLISTPASIVRSLDAHQQRVSWQIRRIYRARNLIVHDGKTPSYCEVLIENIHDYLDFVLNGLMSLASQQRISTIDQGFKYVELNYSAYLSGLKRKGLGFDEGNLSELLFGNLI